MTEPIFTDIQLHAAVVESLREVVNKMGKVDEIEDNLQAAKVLIEIAAVAQKAEEYFEYIRKTALVGAEYRLPEVFSEFTAKRLAGIEAARIAAGGTP